MATEVAVPQRVHLHGTNESFEGDDIFEITPTAGGSQVVYTARMSFSGLSRLAGPLVQAYLPLLASKTVDRLRASLDRQQG